MIGHMGWFQCAQNISGLSRPSGSSMSNHQVLASLYGGLVGYDAVSWHAYAVQTGTDRWDEKVDPRSRMALSYR